MTCYLHPDRAATKVLNIYEDPEEKKPDYDGPSVPGFEGGFAENH